MNFGMKKQSKGPSGDMRKHDKARLDQRESFADFYEASRCLSIIHEAKKRPGSWIGPVYHGSRHKGLKALDVKNHGTGVVMTKPFPVPTLFFTSSLENAAFYADPGDEEELQEYIYMAYVRLKNPLVIDEEEYRISRDSAPMAEIAQEAKKKGHDGFIVKGIIDGYVVSDIYGVFSNDQIRIVGPIKEPGPSLGVDQKLDEDDVEVYGDPGDYYILFRLGEKTIQGPGPFKTEDEAQKEGLRLVHLHNKSLG